MVFEINSLQNATPATVSRAGILFINETDVGWKPYTESWMARRESPNEKMALPGMFDSYIDSIQEATRKGFKQVTPLRVINQVMTLCCLLESMLDSVSEAEKTADLLEHVFAYCCIWAFGGCMAVDKSGDHRRSFSNVWMQTFPAIKFPTEERQGTVFDFFFDPATKTQRHWAERVPTYRHSPIGPEAGGSSFGDIVVQTVDTVRLTALLGAVAQRRRAAMVVGLAGTGKTMLVREFVASLDSNDFKSATIGMNVRACGSASASRMR